MQSELYMSKFLLKYKYGSALISKECEIYQLLSDNKP